MLAAGPNGQTTASEMYLTGHFVSPTVTTNPSTRRETLLTVSPGRLKLRRWFHGVGSHLPQSATGPNATRDFT